MKRTPFHHLVLAVVAALPLLSVADDDTPVPAEVQTLGESFVAAFKAGDAAAIAVCWHSPELLAKIKREKAQQEAGISKEEVNPEKEYQRELKRQTENLARSQKRAVALRALISKHFGDAAGLKLERIEIDPDDDAPGDQPTYDSIEFYLRAQDGTVLRLEVDDVLKLEGAWKLKGRLEYKLTLELTDTD